MSRARAALLSSDLRVQELASAELSARQSALGGVVAGFFVAAGLSPGVLLGPVSLLIGGVGVGGRVFDGRLCQPGRGAKRPRGLLPEAEIPDAARVAVATSVAALAVALAYESGVSLPGLVRPGVAAAERAGAARRAQLLERIAGVGPAALAETNFVQPFLRLASPSQGGLLTPSDFEPPQTIDEPAAELQSGARSWFAAPWAEAASHEGALGHGHAIIAVDSFGRFAALSYRLFDAGLLVPELEVLAPFGAVPVRRGVPRVLPGQRLPCPAPVAITWQDASESVEVVAQPAEARFDPERPSPTTLSIRRDSRTRLVTARG